MKRLIARTGATALAALALLTWPTKSLDAQGPLEAFGVDTHPPEHFTMHVVATGLRDPWEIVWGPDNQLWVTERDRQTIDRINPATGERKILVTITDAHHTAGQDGVLGMALHPGLLKGRGADYVYVSLTYLTGPDNVKDLRTMVRRYTFDAGRGELGYPVDVIKGIPAGDDHIAGRLAFGPDQKLYLTVGDLAANHLWNACHPNHAQDLPTADQVARGDWTLYQGKILRLNLDGSIPADNPILAGVRSHVFSYGHRNPQGLVFGPNGALYSSEHGPNTDDEINLIQAGKNYGWPNVAGYRDDRAYVYTNFSAAKSCAGLGSDPIVPPPGVPRQKETDWNSPDFVPPMRTFFTVDNEFPFGKLGLATIAPSGIDIYTDVRGIPGWANSLLVASLKLGTIFRVKLSEDGKSVVGRTIAYFKSGGRYRDIAIAPDGRGVYVAVDATGSKEHAGEVLEYRYDGLKD